jgi:hypothetical protein
VFRETSPLPLPVRAPYQQLSTTALPTEANQRPVLHRAALRVGTAVAPPATSGKIAGTSAVTPSCVKAGSVRTAAGALLQSECVFDAARGRVAGVINVNHLNEGSARAGERRSLPGSGAVVDPLRRAYVRVHTLSSYSKTLSIRVAAGARKSRDQILERWLYASAGAIGACNPVPRRGVPSLFNSAGASVFPSFLLFLFTRLPLGASV